MKQLDPKAVWLFFVTFALRWFIVIVIFSFWVFSLFLTRNVGILVGAPVPFSGLLSFFWIVPLGCLALCFVWAKLTYRFYRYELTDAGFRKESGVIYKKYVTIPYDRIQNVDIYRGILARLLGLSDLQIQTAGASASFGRYGARGMGAEGRLPALSREVAEQVRDELVQRARSPKSQGL
jgi:uncharacterized membrane protein YdbT with pleckstrin-like domain